MLFVSVQIYILILDCLDLYINLLFVVNSGMEHVFAILVSFLDDINLSKCLKYVLKMVNEMYENYRRPSLKS